jgi:hypothetical protein
MLELLLVQQQLSEVRLPYLEHRLWGSEHYGFMVVVCCTILLGENPVPRNLELSGQWQEVFSGLLPRLQELFGDMSSGDNV